MKVRLKDIAEATGYSVNTISHALRDEPDISESTKKLIRQVAEELEYIPNIHASSIKSGKSRIISIIFPDIINPHFTIVFREIEQFFRKVGITPFFMNTNENIEDELNAVRLSIGQNVDGVIICPTQVNTECVRLLEKSKIPFVLIGRHFEEPISTNYVVCDDAAGSYLATKHLLSMGHVHVACVKINDRISSDRERFAGYCKALDEDGIPFNENLILNLSLTGENNRNAIRDFLNRHPECTAILSFNDILAYGIMREIRSLGKKVPEDISIIGFDNISSDYTFPIALSSVSVSKKNMAHIASEILYKMICAKKPEEGVEAPPTQIVLPTRLFLRETTGYIPRNQEE